MYLLLHSILLFSVLIYSESYDPFGAKRDNSNSELDNIAPSSNLDTEARSYGESGKLKIFHVVITTSTILLFVQPHTEQPLKGNTRLP